MFQPFTLTKAHKVRVHGAFGMFFLLLFCNVLIILYFISYWPGHAWSRLSPGFLEGELLDCKMAWGSNGDDDDGGGEDDDDGDGEDEDEDDEN